VNGDDHAFPGASVKATIYDLNSQVKTQQSATLDIPADSSVRALQLAKVNDISATYFLKLELHDSSGKLVSGNFYWLSTKPDKLDWARKFEEVYTPQSAYADLSGLNSLLPVTLAVRSSLSHEGKESVVHASVQNPGSSLAFMIHLRVARGGSDQDVVPIFWDDNYVSLMPGEKRELSARFDSDKNNDDSLVLTVDGWNVLAASNPIAVQGEH